MCIIINNKFKCMNDLRLSLKSKWFEMTKAGIKTEDYREITPYWAFRLFNKIDKNGINKISSVHWWNGYLTYSENNKYVCGFKNKESIDYINNSFGFKHFNQNIMTLGYPKSTDIERILKLEHKGIEIRTGNPEWGAEPNKLYFVIKHGVILE